MAKINKKYIDIAKHGVVYFTAFLTLFLIGYRNFTISEKEYIESTIIKAGDIVFLPYGGHGLKCLEAVEMIEVKQGPYLGVNDKERFPEIPETKVIINE